MKEFAPVRLATAADRDVLVAGNLAMARETEGMLLDADTLRAEVGAVLDGRAPGHYRLLVDAAGAVAAQLLITYEWSDWRAATVWWIQSVYVWPAYRRRGAYRALYASVLEDARAAGAAGVRLYVDARNAAAMDTYAALGMDGGHYRVFEAMFAEPPVAEPPVAEPPVATGSGSSG